MEKEITLNPGQIGTVRFTVTPSNVGNYTAIVGGFSEAFSVGEVEIEPEYLYFEGQELVSWVQGSRSSVSTGGFVNLAKESNNLFIEARDSRRAVHGTWVTNALIDLTQWNKLAIDWAGVGEDGNDCKYALIISTEKMSGPSIADRSLRATRRFSRRTRDIDVSDLTGLYYIRVHAEDADTGNPWHAALRVYGIWLE